MSAVDADAVLDAELADRDGRPTTLRRVLAGAPTVVVFLRHFG